MRLVSLPSPSVAELTPSRRESSIAPLPPHWVVNVVAPHLGISIYHFWLSTFFGIAGVSYIHTTIGTTLDQMTSSEDFHLISWGNGLGLGGSELARFPLARWLPS